MIYITGDKHRCFDRVYKFLKRHKTTKDDILIVLGDSGINYYLDEQDSSLKEELSDQNITYFIIYGNHEERASRINTYKEKEFCGGKVLYEEKYPNILFALDSEVYDLNNNKTLVIGGAYSSDKEYRLKMGFRWFPYEQPTNVIKKKVLDVIKNNNIDIVLSHTCPFKYQPNDFFFRHLKNSTYDNSTERFLDDVEEMINYKKWYCGHYHINYQTKKISFLYNEIKKFK